MFLNGIAIAHKTQTVFYMPKEFPPSPDEMPKPTRDPEINPAKIPEAPSVPDEPSVNIPGEEPVPDVPEEIPDTPDENVA